MSTQVRLALEHDIDPVCALLHEKMNSRIPVDRWRNLMSYQWLDDKPDFGRVVESDGQVLGFCGMVYADRKIGNEQQGYRHERIVSMSSWYLDKTLRGQGLGRDMLLSAIDDRSLTYATLTNSRKPLGIVEALGFRVLESHRYEWRKTGTVDPAVVVIDDSQSIRSHLEVNQLKILDDMASLPLVPMLLMHADRQALLFFSIKTKGENVTWFDAMHISDPELFAQCAQALANLLLPDAPAVLAVDSRFFQVPPKGALAVPLPVGRYFISQSVEPCELDNLYSELQLLDLKLD